MLAGVYVIYMRNYLKQDTEEGIQVRPFGEMFVGVYTCTYISCSSLSPSCCIYIYISISISISISIYISIYILYIYIYIYDLVRTSPALSVSQAKAVMDPEGSYLNT